MGSGGVAKVGPEDALGGPGAAKSAQGPEGPRKGQGTKILGCLLGSQFASIFVPKCALFFMEKSTGFQIPKWLKK